MKPIKFKEMNSEIAKNQKEYLTLPAWKSNEQNGEVISCWRLTIFERIKLLFMGKVWVRVWTFNNPLQPQCLQIEYPFIQKNLKS